LGVWWEDCVYVLPFLVANKYILEVTNKYLRISLAVAAALMFIAMDLQFVSGHLYQGPAGLLSFAYPIVSFHYARLRGLGSMMMLHIIYDFSIYVPMYAIVDLLL